MSKSKKILLKMSGSIAAYKVCHLISKLTQAGHEVQVVTSPHMHHFIGNSTLEGLSQKAVISDTFESQGAMSHIHLMRWADLILAAPATANFINKITAGVADDLLSTLFLAHDFKKPYLVAPAMNTSMYEHPITQQSIAKLRQIGIEILETESGALACGEMGLGRLLEPESILKKIESRLNRVINSSTPHVLITAGGTSEPLDSMRVLTNLSTGRTAIGMAEYFYDQGMNVTVLAANSSVKPQYRDIPFCCFSSFSDLELSLKKLVSTNEYAAVIHAAAVSDFSVCEISQNNISLQVSKENKINSNSDLMIRLKPNPKLLPQIKAWSKLKSTLVFGFKFTSTQNLVEQKNAVRKLFLDGSVDFVVHNDSHQINRDKNQHMFSFYSASSISDSDHSSNSIIYETPKQLYQSLLTKIQESR